MPTGMATGAGRQEGTETLTLGDVSFQGIAFGCGNNNVGDFSNSSGVVGLGRGPLSLISQLGMGKFSYCFKPFDDPKPSKLLLGSSASASETLNGGIPPVTPLLASTANPTFYYVNLLGITVGRTRLRIPRGTFELQKDGSGGIIIDSGTSFTNLDSRAYDVLAKRFTRELKLPRMQVPETGLDLCFKLPSHRRVKDAKIRMLGGRRPSVMS